jgi:hypothetical protein
LYQLYRRWDQFDVNKKCVCLLLIPIWPDFFFFNLMLKFLFEKFKIFQNFVSSLNQSCNSSTFLIQLTN